MRKRYPTYNEQMADIASTGFVVLLSGIVAILLVAVRRGDFATVANALVSLVAALVPAGVELLAPYAVGVSPSLGPVLPVWIAAAGLVHSIGMLGPYDTIAWWDSVTHTVSAALVAALVYAGLVVVGRHGGFLDPSFGALAALTVGFTFAAGVFWELIELVARDVGQRYDVEPVLVQYGRGDTALDLVFDVVGALLVVVFDLRVFVPIAEQSPAVTGSLVRVSAAVVVLGSAVLALAARGTPDDGP